jgi:hypothetical protein
MFQRVAYGDPLAARLFHIKVPLQHVCIFSNIA